MRDRRRSSWRRSFVMVAVFVAGTVGLLALSQGLHWLSLRQILALAY